MANYVFNFTVWRLKMNKYYSTKEVLQIIATVRGIKANDSYIHNVIMRDERKQPHPLKRARLFRGTWSKRIVDKWAADNTPKSLQAPS